jgi:hypothetical protein
MNIEIEIKNTGTFAYATVNINGVEMLTRPFASVEDAEKWAEIVKPEEPKPAWTPEVGMLIRMVVPSANRDEVVEITRICQGVYYFSNNTFCYSEEEVYECCKPIAELEGLDIGGKVYSIKEDGGVYDFCIVEEHCEQTFWIESCSLSINSNEKGIPVHFGNGKQMFWRTAERAERFGK